MSQELSRTSLRLRRTIIIGLGWALAGLVATLFEAEVLDRAGLPVNMRRMLPGRVLEALLVGLLGGGAYIFLLRDRIRRLPYVHALSVAALLVLIVVSLVHAVLPAWREGDMGLVAGRLFTLGTLTRFLFWSGVMAITMLLVRLNDQYGSGGLGYFAGRYHKPRQELRIFMFLDMRSSTSIAEDLGHVKFFQLLNELFTDITDPIIYSRGEIYQYVGDEVSVTWPLRRGIRSQNCVRCFFSIRRKLQRKAAHYKERYGIVPAFKAGLHYGPVTTGQVGLVKKEMIFSGDVVNTAARIQNSCNAHGVDLLLSKDLLDVLNLPGSRYLWREIGEIPLRGKRNAMSLWTLGEQERDGKENPRQPEGGEKAGMQGMHTARA